MGIIEIYPEDIGAVKPLRVNRVFYDEFIFHSHRYNIPFEYIMFTVMCIGIAGFFYFLISGYVFGKLKHVDGLERLSNLNDLDEGSRGYGILKALESDFFNELKAEEEREK